MPTRPAPWLSLPRYRKREQKQQRRPIPRVSEKRLSELGMEAEMKRNFLKLHPWCEVCLLLDRKPRKSRDHHHRRGRAGRLRLAVQFWTACCRYCHDFIGNNIKWAKDVGLIENWGKQP